MSWQIWPSVSPIQCSLNTLDSVGVERMILKCAADTGHDVLAWNASASVCFQSSSAVPLPIIMFRLHMLCYVQRIRHYNARRAPATLCLTIEAMSDPHTHSQRCAVTRIDRNMNSYERARVRPATRTTRAYAFSRLNHRRAQRNAPVYRELLNRTLDFYSMLSRTIDTIRWTLRTLNSLIHFTVNSVVSPYFVSD